MEAMASEAHQFRRTHSWSPAGVSRREVRLQLLPEYDRQTRSFVATGVSQADLDNTRVFGGIERRVRLDPPRETDVMRFENFSFRYRETCGMRPHVIAFVNSRSGGQTGRLLMETLAEHIGDPPRAFSGKVCDLSLVPDEPAATIDDMARNHLAASPRLLVCGGDGTVTWILTELENCKELGGRSVPVAVLPLGTGNDLAQSLGWGGTFRARRDLLRYLEWVAQATPVQLDQWELVLRPHQALPPEHKLRAELGSHPRFVSDARDAEQLLADMEEALPHSGPSSAGPCREVYLGFWQNYFEIGAGAKVVALVDSTRNNTRCGQCLFRSGLGKVVYAKSLPSMFCQRCVTDSLRDLMVAPEPDGALRPLHPPLHETSINGALGRAREVVFANINSFVGGMAGNFLPLGSSPADGRIEVLMWRNMLAVAGTAIGCARAAHVASAGQVAFTLEEGAFMEVDGEPWEVPGATDVLVRRHRRVSMLCAPPNACFWRRHINSGFWLQAPVDAPQGCT